MSSNTKDVTVTLLNTKRRLGGQVNHSTLTAKDTSCIYDSFLLALVVEKVPICPYICTLQVVRMIMSYRGH